MRVVLPPISKDEDGIPQYVQARLMVLTLLFSQLEACHICYIARGSPDKGTSKFYSDILRFSLALNSKLFLLKNSNFQKWAQSIKVTS